MLNTGAEAAEGPKQVKADFKPEIYFIGQIVGGTDFPTDQDGIFIEASLKFVEDWKQIPEMKAG